MVMYYAGDAVEIATMVLLCARWSRHARRPARLRARLSVEDGAAG
jgi:cytochrome c oxidase assembly factor CtaG